ncbi:MAG: right-handed parallel beta-helix repeat-containing protein [Candidatus Zixiibacteriota bacterium]|nr:MAG: right-handed parallel beta-helix repeat-containing protein [candidate division Zixibacteria bacterium]
MRPLICFVVLLWTTSAHSTTIRVPSGLSSIEDALAFASDGDTVLVEPGLYRVNADFDGKDVVVISEAGPLVTFLKPDTTALPVFTFTSSEPATAEVSGFTISGGRGAALIHIQEASPTIKGNRFTDHESYIGNGAVIFVRQNSASMISQNLFWDNPGAYAVIWGGNPSSPTIINNTVYTGRVGMVLWCEGAIVLNNIVTNCNAGVSVTREMTRGYNNIWGNVSNFSSGSPAPTDISVNPLYIDPSSLRFGLQPVSPCIDAGDPYSWWNDPDGTRSDMGALFFDQRTPIAHNLSIGAEDIAHVVSHSPTFVWSYHDPQSGQAAYEIEVGTDPDWSSAELWASGEIWTADTLSTYSGSSLADGEVYYWRVRVARSSDSAWGAWTESVFRMNTPPPVPSPIWPVQNDQASVVGIQCIVASVEDNEGDSVNYDFEIYAEQALITLLAAEYGVGEQTDSVRSGFFDGLSIGTTYWWVARAADGFEASDWSTAEPFEVRDVMTHDVPSVHGTIQAGMDFAQQGDTVLVAPGLYFGTGNRDLDFRGKGIVVKSDSGAVTTIIDCGGSESDPHIAFYFNSGEDTSSVVDGFKILNAYSGSYQGAAIEIWSSPVIRNCIILDNQCGGISCQSWYYNWYGRKHPVIDSCDIQDNATYGIRSASDGRITNCVILNNGGNGIDLWSPDSIEIAFNFVYGNEGSGLYVLTGSLGNFQIHNNTFAYNTQGIDYYHEPPASGFEMTLTDYSGLMSQNLIVYSLHGGVVASGIAIAPMECNNSFGNTENDWPLYYYLPHAGDSAGNLSLDPLFCDTTDFLGCFRIDSISPCAPDNPANQCGLLIGALGVGCKGAPDSDNDGIADVNDNCPEDSNPDQADIDDDGIGDVCDPTCCVDSTGNVDGDPDDICDMGDLTALIDYMFISYTPPACMVEANIDGEGVIDVADLTRLIDFLFISFTPPAPCQQ